MNNLNNSMKIQNLSDTQLEKYGIPKLNHEYLEFFSFLREPTWIKHKKISLFDEHSDTIILEQWENRVNKDTHEYIILCAIKCHMDTTVGELLDTGYYFEIKLSTIWHDSSLTESDLILRPMLTKCPVCMIDSSKLNGMNDLLDTPQKRFEEVIKLAKASYEKLFKEIKKAQIHFPWLPS